MAPVKLKCTFGDTNCNFETQELEFQFAEKLLESHLKFAHPIPGASNNDRKPEKFPRPDLKLDSSAEVWSEVLVTWQQYEEEYNLAGARSDSSLPAALRTFAPVYRELWAAVSLIKQRPR